MNKKERGIFLKIIPDGASQVKDFYLSPSLIKFLKVISIFILVVLSSITLFSLWMLGNFVKMKMLEYEANKVKIQEKKIKELESKLEKFILFSKKLENLLKPEEVLKTELKNIKENLDFAQSEISENKDKEPKRSALSFDLPVKGIISNFYSPLHPGIDIVSSSGTPVRAPFDGIVKEKGIDENYGLYLWIEHSGGIKTFYGHLMEIKVKKGEWVRKGEIIGRVGNTGKSTGPHLHFEIWSEGFPVNPLNFTNYNIFALKYRSK
ncbi:MAG: M23 family metallopeptidase [candidate division WOR-3 bacterium]